MDNVQQRLVDGVIGREGKYSNNPKDAGGETMWGITVARARAAGYTGPMVSMPRSTAADIYYLFYIRQPGFDQIFLIDPPLGERLIDAGINCGTARASEWLQRGLNVLNREGTIYRDITVDGQAGAMTRGALNSLIQARGETGRLVIRECVRAMQAMHYITLSENKTSQEEFTFGWISNRIISLG